MALKFHPDRQADRAQGARERAEFRMREVNEAWAVLRNPAARAHYDDELRREADALRDAERIAAERSADTLGLAVYAPATANVMGNRRPLGLVPDEVADLAPADPSDVVGTGSSRWLVWGPVLVGALLLVVLVVVVAIAPSGPSEPIKVQTVEDFGVGTCVDIIQTPGETPPNLVVPKPCTEEHTARIVRRIPLSRDCRPGEHSVIVPDENIQLCVVE